MCRSWPWLSALASAAEDTIRIGLTIPEEAKYGIMRCPDRFANLGKTYKAEFTQFQGTAPVVQAMIAGALNCSTQAPLSLANGSLKRTQGHTTMSANGRATSPSIGR